MKDPTAGAQKSLKGFRQATMLAVVLTGFLLMFFDPLGAQDGGDQLPDTVTVIEEYDLEELKNAEAGQEEAQDPDVIETAGQALGAVKGILKGFLRLLPRILVAVGILLIIYLLLKLVNYLIKKVLGHWERTEGITTLVAIIFWLTGIGLAMSVIAGDIRALIGSLGLVGLALSWALQSPIESGTGWLLNKFKGYYRVGDRIVVGEVFGDVYKIDLINTTLWEIGDPFSSGFVNAEQPTGRLVTFPNSEILNGIVVNLTSDFPYVWDELAVQVANESDLRYTLEVLGKVARDLLEEQMKGPAKEYERILLKAGLEQQIDTWPQTFLSASDSWSNINIRYLVGARERRKWKSELELRTAIELNKAEHRHRIIPAYERRQLQIIDDQGRPQAPQA
ncbi:MAG: mechanosensitive ion channel family protein [Bacteroidota bacterium]|nr:mechanosensitive ion channel family protein [Bacteroidota bacterium]